MCGIFGVLGELSASIDKNLSETIIDTLVRRGPDNQTFRISDGYCLGHTRLSVIGLGEDSNQPYTKKDSQWIMSFNGEIYNFKDLRIKLISEGCVFESNSDTEVLYRGFCLHGKSFFNDIRGMFAVAFYNPETQQVVLARDYSGEKPLYYQAKDNSVIFSSCISSIEACFSENLSLEETNIDRFLHYQFVPSQFSIFSEITNLSPGSILEISIPSLKTIENVIALPKGEKIADKGHALNLIRRTFRAAVERTLVSDVPIALSLSGGLDSVSIASQIREIDSDLKVTSFTAGYEGDFDFDERKIARRVASEFGFEHIELEISKNDFIADFPRLIESMNSPIADLAAYPQFRIAEAMNLNKFKVGILGIGGDELFWGYNWAIETLGYTDQSTLEEASKHEKSWSLKQRLIHSRHSYFNKKYSEPKPTPGGYPVFYEKLGDFNSPFLLKKEFLNKEIFSGDKSIYEVLSRAKRNDIPQLQFQSILTDNWLTCNSLALADSLGMYNSVEYRLPFLDLDLVDLSTSLTRDMFHESRNKNLFREALFDLVPAYVRDRDKSGFRFPSNLWLPELLSEYEFELTSGQLVTRGLARANEIKRLLQGSRRTWSKQFLLYKLLVLEFYLENHSKIKMHE